MQVSTNDGSSPPTWTRNCGPAVVRVHLHGASYRISGGRCRMGAVLFGAQVGLVGATPAAPAKSFLFAVSDPRHRSGVFRVSTATIQLLGHAFAETASYNLPSPPLHCSTPRCPGRSPPARSRSASRCETERSRCASATEPASPAASPAADAGARRENCASGAGADDLRVAHPGDFHPGNVLVRDGRVAGIVDWQYSRRTGLLLSCWMSGLSWTALRRRSIALS